MRRAHKIGRSNSCIFLMSKKIVAIASQSNFQEYHGNSSQPGLLI
ncbi:MAG TPA: hypothetical protein V6C78_17080 [Crinalium sp.]